jgi:uroporphyrinogen decarboxylase
MAGLDHPFLAACRREKTAYTPIWLMRQAGRYLEEYRKIRAEVGFIDLCKRPDLAAEITVTTVERLGVDAAIVFSDILLLLEPAGVGVEYTKDNGPKVSRPLREPSDVDKFKEFDAEKEMAYVFEAVRRSCAGLGGKVPLIGFSGAPFTLAAYLIEGGSSRDYLEAKKFIYRHNDAWRRLMERLTAAVIGYLDGQVKAGAQAVQLFDSWVGCLSPEDYRGHVLPFTQTIVAALRPKVPVIHFSAGTAGMLKLLRETGSDVLSLDWRCDLDEAWAALGYDVAVQGNLDPAALLAPPQAVRQRATEILKRAVGRPGHIFNLGHGVLPGTPVDHVLALVDAVHELSAKGKF